MTKKPSRKELLRVLTHVQGDVGEAMNLIRDDRDDWGKQRGLQLLEKVEALLIEARSYDPPTDL